MLTLDAELYMLAVMTATGAMLGLCVDLYRAARQAWLLTGLTAVVQDVLVVLACASLLAGGLVLGTWGAIRLVVLVGLGLGILLYSGLASPVVYGTAYAGLVRVRRSYGRAVARVGGAARRGKVRFAAAGRSVRGLGLRLAGLPARGRSAMAQGRRVLGRGRANAAARLRALLRRVVGRGRRRR